VRGLFFPLYPFSIYGELEPHLAPLVSPFGLSIGYALPNLEDKKKASPTVPPSLSSSEIHKLFAPLLLSLALLSSSTPNGSGDKVMFGKYRHPSPRPAPVTRDAAFCVKAKQLTAFLFLFSDGLPMLPVFQKYCILESKRDRACSSRLLPFCLVQALFFFSCFFL